MIRFKSLLSSSLILCLAAVLQVGLVSAQTSGQQPLRLLFDDYYHKPRPEGQFGQGIARGDIELRNLSNFYSPEANAIPNGTFVISNLIADKFDTRNTQLPISREMLKEADAYMLFCPIREEHGGRANLTEEDAIILDEFVTRGGILILVANSASDLETSSYDFTGLNRIGARFGVKFETVKTDTLSLPISPDHPTFDGVSGMIFGSGTTLTVTESEGVQNTVLFESYNPKVPGPVAVVSQKGQGKVLYFGDGGTFGNAHMFRHDIGHAESVRQMLYSLLPDGPLPRYRWKEGTTLQVTVRQEQTMSGYPEHLRVFKLPMPEGTIVYSSGMREIDRAASGQSTTFESKDFASAVSLQSSTFELKIGEGDITGNQATWHGEEGTMQTKLLPSGRVINPTLPNDPELAQWQSHLVNELIAAPLKSYAVSGEKWTALSSVALPHAQFSLTPKWIESPSDYSLVGEAEWDGMPCLLIRKVSSLDSSDWTPADLIDDRNSALFNEANTRFLAGGLYSVAHYWISTETNLPVHSEIKMSATLWWTDPKFPGKYIGTHDNKNYENWENVNLVISFGRTLSADFKIR